jgi:DNA-binding XRE family transcriptional regulator
MSNQKMIRAFGNLERSPSKPLVLTPKQLRAARALLGWSREQLASESGVPLPTLNKIEVGKTDPKLTTAGKLRRTLEDAGVIFVDPTAEHGPGVILREGKRAPRRG